MWGSGSVTAMMVVVECLDVGLNILSKAAMRRGMSDFVFVVYSNALGFFFLLPSSFIFYRKRNLPLPPLTFPIICKLLVISLLSCVCQLLKFIGIDYGSPTLASAMVDLMPAFTFILAVITRMEILDLRIASRQAKCIGTVVSISGALIVTLYKGITLIRADPSPKNNLQLFVSPRTNWFIGGIVLAFQSFLLALMHIIETWVIRDYPEVLMVTFLRSIFITILSAAISLIAEKGLTAWLLKADIELIAIGYYAAFEVIARSGIHLWALRKEGPVYVAMFKPLGIVITLFIGVTFFGDALYLGRFLGAFIIAVGFYAVIWGQAQEDKEAQNHQMGSLESRSLKQSLF